MGKGAQMAARAFDHPFRGAGGVASCPWGRAFRPILLGAGITGILGSITQGSGTPLLPAQCLVHRNSIALRCSTLPHHAGASPSNGMDHLPPGQWIRLSCLHVATHGQAGRPSLTLTSNT